MTVILLSGGLDSALLPAIIPGPKLAICFDYGQMHRREIQSACYIASYYNIELQVKQIPMYGNALRTQDPDSIAHATVPQRNMIMLSNAAAIAQVEGHSDVAIGIHASDNPFPDCTRDFLVALGRAIYLGSNRQIYLQTPLIDKTKRQCLKWGLQLDAPYHLTWSCYRGLRHPCGTCPACAERKYAFAGVDAKDPLCD